MKQVGKEEEGRYTIPMKAPKGMVMQLQEVWWESVGMRGEASMEEGDGQTHRYCRHRHCRLLTEKSLGTIQ